MPHCSVRLALSLAFALTAGATTAMAQAAGSNMTFKIPGQKTINIKPPATPSWKLNMSGKPTVNPYAPPKNSPYGPPPAATKGSQKGTSSFSIASLTRPTAADVRAMKSKQAQRGQANRAPRPPRQPAASSSAFGMGSRGGRSGRMGGMGGMGGVRR